MNTTLKIEGMSCGHCTATVEKALRAVPGVTDVRVDLAAKTASVTANDGVAPKALADAVTETGFDVVGTE